MTFQAATLNAPRKVGRKDWETCWERAAARSDVFVVNETLTPRQKRTYRRLAIREGWLYRGLWTSPNPIFWKRDRFTLYSHVVVKLHGRGKGWRARRWPGFNSARYANVTVLRDRRDALPLNTFVGFHLVPNGRKVLARWRKRMRARSINRLRRICTHHQSLGRTVTAFGDANYRGEMHLGPGFRWIFKDIDRLGGMAPAGYEMIVGSKESFVIPSDHPTGKSAEINYREKGNR